MLLFAIFLFVSGTPCEAKYSNTYKNLCTINNQQGCASMQGMDTGNGYIYCAKITSGNEKAILVRYSLSGGKEEELMTNVTGKNPIKYCSFLQHANDMAFLEAGSTDYLYVVTGKTSPAVVKLEINGNKYKKVGEFNFQGNPNQFWGIDIMKTDSENITFLLNNTNVFYTATIKKSANTGTVQIKKYCQLSDDANGFKKTAKVNGVTCDLTGYNQQGFCYANNKIYVPLTKGNISVVLTYDNIDNIQDPNTNLICGEDSYRITSSQYAKLFEIEGVAIRDNKLYFSCNTRKEGVTKYDTDFVGYFK